MDVSALRRLEEPASLQAGDPGCRKELPQTCKQAVCGHCHFVGTEMGLCSTVQQRREDFIVGLLLSL